MAKPKRSGKEAGEILGRWAAPIVTVAPPGDTNGNSIVFPNGILGDGTGGTGYGDGGGGGGGGASAAQSAARAASRKQNEQTQKILDALLDSIQGYREGRDTQLANANRALNLALRGISANYDTAFASYEDAAERNAQDYDTKTAATNQNRARERIALLMESASQGAGETDQLRSQLQAFLNADNNQMEAATARADTEQSILSNIDSLNAQTESQRRSAWMQSEEARGQAWNDYWKNYTDAWTNIQRTEAGNTNTASDFSEEFNADLRGKDSVEEASRYAGRAYTVKDQDEDWFKRGQRQGRQGRTTASQRAGAVTIEAPQRAEGATLRNRW